MKHRSIGFIDSLCCPFLKLTALKAHSSTLAQTGFFSTGHGPTSVAPGRALAHFRHFRHFSSLVHGQSSIINRQSQHLPRLHPVIKWYTCLAYDLIGFMSLAGNDHCVPGPGRAKPQ